jgi:hypothetical protein
VVYLNVLEASQLEGRLVGDGAGCKAKKPAAFAVEEFYFCLSDS